MPPTKSPTASPRSLPLPKELRDTLREAAKVNRNYEPTALTASVRRDIERALIDRDGEVFPEDIRNRNAAVLSEAVRARVAQIKRSDGQNLLWGKRDRGDLPKVFRASPRTTAKSVQEVLTDPADRVAVAKTAGMEPEGYGQLALCDIIIDPRRLSDHLLKNLGLQKFVAPKGTPPIDRINYKIDAIPHVKEMLSYLEPVSLPESRQRKCYRLFLITDGPKAGYILGVQEIAGDDRMFITTLHGTKRRIDHIEDGYVRELAQLARIKNALDEIDLSLDQDWQALKLPRRMRMLLATLHGLVEELEFVIDEDKRELHDAIEKAATLLARKNKGAARACLNEMRRNRLIGGRQQEIPRIFGELAKDKLLLQAVIEQEENALEEIYLKVKEQKGEPRLLTPDELSDADLAAICTKLERLASRMTGKHIKFQPNRTFADKLAYYLNKSRTLLDPKNDDGSPTDGAEAFMRAFVVSKLARFHHFLLALYEAFSVHAAHGLSIPEWRGELETAESELNERTTGKKIFTPEFNALWINLRGLIANIKKIMDEFGRTKSKEKRLVVIERMKQLISEFDLPSRVAAVPLKNE